MASESKRRMKAIVKDPEHCNRMVQSLQLFNSQQSYTDLCFVCARGLKVYAHKLLVCSVSTQLKELLLQLPDNLSKITIHVPDIDSRILQLIINLLYEGNVRVCRQEYDKFKEIMSLLGIVLEPPRKDDDDSGMNENPPPPPPAPLAPTPQMLYLPNPSSSQDGVQYVLAPSSMVQGSLMSSGVQPSTSSPSSSSVAQPLMIPTSTSQVQSGNQMVQLVQSQGGQMVPISGSMIQTINGQMVQTINGQIVQPVNSHMVQPASQTVQTGHSPMMLTDSHMVQPVNSPMMLTDSHMVQPVNSPMMLTDSHMVQPVNSHMVQPASQTVQTGKSPMMLTDSHMVHPCNNQILPNNNQMIHQTATQMVKGAQMVVQNNRHTIINNTTTRVNLKDQTEARESVSSMGFRQIDTMFSVRKRTHPHPRSLSSTTNQLNLSSVRDRTIMRRRTGPIVTGVHSLANVQGGRSRTGTISRNDQHINRAGQLVRRNQNPFS